MSCPSTSSGLKSSSAVVINRPARLHGVIAIADGTNAATVTIYDNASAAAGTELAQIIVDATLTYESFNLEGGIEAKNGLYVALAGTGAKAIVLFSIE